MIFRRNDYIEALWNRYNILTREHFYHVGGSEKNRNPMVEAIVTNYCTSPDNYKLPKIQDQLALLENQAPYSP